MSRAPPMNTIALPRWQRMAIYASVTLLVASGVAWLVVVWPIDSDISQNARAAATWFLRLHGISAYATLIVVGAVLPVHLRLAWAKRRNRWSGAVLVAVFALLALTGLWLYYGGEGGRSVVSLCHWVIGLVLPIWLAIHRARGLRSRNGTPH
jgi:hypothetical protein